MRARSAIQIAVVCGLMTLTLAGLSSPQKSADPSQLIKASITIDADKLARGKPGVVKITIENISDREADLKSISSFELLRTSDEAIARDFSVFGDSYWSPLDLATGTPLRLDADPKMLKRGVVEGRVPDALLHFSKDETKTFSVDLTKLLWNASMGNDWPRWNLFEAVPKGRYSLVFRIQSGGHLRSNEVKITIE